MLSCQTQRLARSLWERSYLDASCRLTQDLYNCSLMGTGSPCSPSVRGHAHSLLPFLSVLKASCTGMLGNTWGSPGKLLGIPQSPLSPVQRPPPTICTDLNQRRSYIFLA